MSFFELKILLFPITQLNLKQEFSNIFEPQKYNPHPREWGWGGGNEPIFTYTSEQPHQSQLGLPKVCTPLSKAMPTQNNNLVGGNVTITLWEMGSQLHIMLYILIAQKCAECYMTRGKKTKRIYILH